MKTERKKTRAAKAARKLKYMPAIFGELWAFMRIRKKWWL